MWTKGRRQDLPDDLLDRDEGEVSATKARFLAQINGKAAAGSGAPALGVATGDANLESLADLGTEAAAKSNAGGLSLADAALDRDMAVRVRVGSLLSPLEGGSWKPCQSVIALLHG